MIRPLYLAGLLALLGGCATAPSVQTDATASTLTTPGTAPPPEGAPLPSGELTQDQALALALANSPTLAAARAQAEADRQDLLDQSRPALLGFSLERLRRGDDKELNRTLSINLLDWLTWPWRAQRADAQVKASEMALSRQLLSHTQQVRSQWVRAVAAQQRLRYREDLLAAAQAQAALAQRLQQAGHLSSLEAQSQSLWQSEAEIDLLHATQQATQEREALVRLIGLRTESARRMELPPQLPDLPAAQRDSALLTQAAREQGLDTQVAYTRWQALSSRRQQLGWTSWLELEAGIERNSSRGEATQHGGVLDIRLTRFDFGAAQRDAGSSAERAALLRWQQSVVDAESTLREQIAQEGIRWQQARHHHLTLQPARARLLDERLKHYNGMLTGPFELIAEARGQVEGVLSAIDADEAYWLSRIATDAAIQGVGAEGGRRESSLTPATSHTGSPA
ncbi:TolC family protein [Aquabacterium sp.]|uniref:TolC family protein n=1 Tax=Aquabacterium sp. TaxID=1872578 RepID=UPI0035AEC9EC